MRIRLKETCGKVRLKSPLDVFLPLFTMVHDDTEYIDPAEVVRTIYLAHVLSEMDREIEAKVAPIRMEILKKYLRDEPLLREVLTAALENLEEEICVEATPLTPVKAKEEPLEAYICTYNNMSEFEISNREAKVLQLEGSDVVELSLKDFIEKAFLAALKVYDITFVARALHMLRTARGKVET
ncbi:MAG: hypothetical protein ACXQTI_04455 [Candidatus Nezhaarchaeales archaeon]